MSVFLFWYLNNSAYNFPKFKSIVFTAIRNIQIHELQRYITEAVLQRS